jgi:hypothetical protein
MFKGRRVGITLDVMIGDLNACCDSFISPYTSSPRNIHLRLSQMSKMISIALYLQRRCNRRIRELSGGVRDVVSKAKKKENAIKLY